MKTKILLKHNIVFLTHHSLSVCPSRWSFLLPVFLLVCSLRCLSVRVHSKNVEDRNLSLTFFGGIMFPKNCILRLRLCQHTRLQIHAHTRTHASTHTHTHTHTHPHTHTHTHTHTQSDCVRECVGVVVAAVGRRGR